MAGSEPLQADQRMKGARGLASRSCIASPHMGARGWLAQLLPLRHAHSSQEVGTSCGGSCHSEGTWVLVGTHTEHQQVAEGTGPIARQTRGAIVPVTCVRMGFHLAMPSGLHRLMPPPASASQDQRAWPPRRCGHFEDQLPSRHPGDTVGTRCLRPGAAILGQGSPARGTSSFPNTQAHTETGGGPRQGHVGPRFQTGQHNLLGTRAASLDVPGSEALGGRLPVGDEEVIFAFCLSHCCYLKLDMGSLPLHRPVP